MVKTKKQQLLSRFSQSESFFYFHQVCAHI